VSVGHDVVVEIPLAAKVEEPNSAGVGAAIIQFRKMISGAERKDDRLSGCRVPVAATWQVAVFRNFPGELMSQRPAAKLVEAAGVETSLMIACICANMHDRPVVIDDFAQWLISWSRTDSQRFTFRLSRPVPSDVERATCRIIFRE